MKKRKGLTSEEHRQRVQDFCAMQMDLLLDKIKIGQSEKWSKPWGNNFSGLGRLPHNPKTKHRYTGQNLLFLSIDMIVREFEDPRYMTLDQAKVYAEENGLDPNKVRIKKGSKAAMILQPVVIEKKYKSEKKEESKSEGSKADEAIDAAESNDANEDKTDGKKEVKRKIVKFKTSPRFNGSQLTGLPDFKLDKTQSWSSNGIVDHLFKTNDISVLLSDQAAFLLKSDKIEMPDIKDFEAPEQHTSTMLHEFYHWTGGQKREKRISENYKEFHDNYAKEEIRAQFFMLASSAMLGLPIKTDQEIDYIQHFSRKDGLDYRAVYKEFAQASKMFNNMLVPFILNEQPEVAWFPEKENWPARSEQVQQEAIIAEAIVLGQGPLSGVEDEKWHHYGVSRSDGVGLGAAPPDHADYQRSNTHKGGIVTYAEPLREDIINHYHYVPLGTTETGVAYKPQAEPTSEQEITKKQWHHYGVKHPRGVGLGASPPDHADYQLSDKYLGGIVTYATPLSAHDVEHYTYEPLGITEAGQPFVKEGESPDQSGVDPYLAAILDRELSLRPVAGGSDVFDLIDDVLPASTDAFDLLDSPPATTPQAVVEEKKESTEQTQDSTDPFDLIPDQEASSLSDWDHSGPRR